MNAPVPTRGVPDLDALLPHAGRSRLIAAVRGFDRDRIACDGVPPSDPAHPLRVGGRLWAAAAIEYGAQAMAAHGALVAAADAPPRVGYLVAVRDVAFAMSTLDGIDGPLQVEAERVAALGDQVSYAFRVRTREGAPVAEGRANVSLRGDPAAGPALRG